MDKGNYSVEIPDLDYWKTQIKCQYACPVHTDSRAYVRAIAAGDYEKAYLIARGPNPLASICGRVCGAPCEAACRRTDFDQAVSIRALKRFVTEKFGVETGQYSRQPLQLIERLGSRQAEDCLDYEDIKHLLAHFRNPAIADDAPSVGIIGSGPAGLAAAHDLCLMGIKPVIYEMEPVPAGRLCLGAPEYRLPRDLVRAEIEVIQKMGTEIICDSEVGKDVTISDLRAWHAAVLIAVGAKKSRKIPIPNIDAPGVGGGVEFLRDISLNRYVELGEKVIVIGGGNVAYDVARTLVRQTAFDGSGSAMRRKGVKQVCLVCLESLPEMPADEREIREGEEEGIVRYNAWGPKEILVDDRGRTTGVAFVRCRSIFDENRRFAPRFDESEAMRLCADNVFLAIGQATDLTFIDSDDIALNESSQLELSSTFAETEAEGVFAAGDVVHGPKMIIDAIAGGKQAARKIYAYLKKSAFATQLHVTHEDIKDYQREWGYECVPREGVPTLPPAERKNAMNKVVETGFSEDQGRRQADRCLNCAVNTIFDSRRCILCGGCADVCPENCLKLVPLQALRGNADVAQLIRLDAGDAEPEAGGAIIKDETRCIRCGLCAERCPVDAVSMETFNFKEMWLNEG